MKMHFDGRITAAVIVVTLLATQASAAVIVTDQRVGVGMSAELSNEGPPSTGSVHYNQTFIGGPQLTASPSIVAAGDGASAFASNYSSLTSSPYLTSSDSVSLVFDIRNTAKADGLHGFFLPGSQAVAQSGPRQSFQVTTPTPYFMQGQLVGGSTGNDFRFYDLADGSFIGFQGLGSFTRSGTLQPSNYLFSGFVSGPSPVAGGSASSSGWASLKLGNAPGVIQGGSFDNPAQGMGGDAPILSQVVGWIVNGPGTANIVQSLINPADFFLKFIAGSPVSIEQTVDTDASKPTLAYSSNFLDLGGSLNVYLGGSLIDTLAADAGQLNVWTNHTVAIPSGLLGQSNQPLRFLYDGPGDTSLLLDNVAFAVPEPAGMPVAILAALFVLNCRKSGSCERRA